MKLNLGCGQDIRPDYINLDKRDWGQQIVRDVLRGIPFNDETFDEVFTSHFMEHIAMGEDLYFVVSEVWRVLKPHGVFNIIVPHSETQEAFFPDHLSFWNEKMLKALLQDPYQSYGKYSFAIKRTERVGIELHALLEKTDEHIGS